jgi:O-antigen ligase
MSSRAAPAVLWATLLWSALLAGILVAWSPRYWAVSVAIGALSVAVVSWMAVSTLRGGDFAWPRQTPLVVLIGAWGFLQVFFKTTAIPGLTMGNSLIWLMSACAFVVGAQILRHRATRKLFLQLLLWSVTALAVIAMIQATSHPVEVFGIFPADDRVMGTFLSQNQFAALMELAAPVALWYMIGRNPLPGGLCYAMLLAGTITAASRMGVALVGSEALAFAIIVLLTRRLETRRVAAIFAGLALLVGSAMVIAGTDKVRTHFEDKNPYAIRRQLFDSTVHLVAERPWTGYGIGTWRAEYPHTATFDLALLANEAHNDWLEWAAEGGILFSLLIGVLVIWIAGPAIQSIWGLGILCVMIHSYVDYPLREPVLSFLWFTLAGAVASFSE